jgi:hypothetical protein
MSWTYDSSWITTLIRSVKGLTLKDRQDDYVRQFQTELRTRLCVEIGTLENQWQKKEVYRITIPVVFEFEFEYMLLSVYFDEDADYLLNELSTVFLNHKPIRYRDEYSLLRLLESDGDFHGKVQRYLDILFLERAGLRAARPKPGSHEYPEINHVVTWIQKQLVNQEGAAGVRFALLHFSKFWQMKYANPFNFQSGILFLAKLELCVRNLTLEEVKVDLSAALKSAGLTISALIPQQLSSPVLNLFNPSTMKTVSNTGYINRIRDFQTWNANNALRFQDLSKSSFYELFNSYCNTQQDLKEVFLREIRTRFDRGEGLLDIEVKQFLQVHFSELSSDGQKLLDEIKRINYLFA